MPRATISQSKLRSVSIVRYDMESNAGWHANANSWMGEGGHLSRTQLRRNSRGNFPPKQAVPDFSDERGVGEPPPCRGAPFSASGGTLHGTRHSAWVRRFRNRSKDRDNIR